MQRMMNEENDWDRIVEDDAVESPVVCVSREVLQALNDMKTGKAPGPSEVLLEVVAASGGVRIKVMAEICQSILNGCGMPAEWTLYCILYCGSNLQGKGDIWNCSCY